MIQSMTGYGNAVVAYKDKKIHVEIKSLNSKPLDLQTRIAPLYREKEMEVRQMVAEALIRGKVDMSVWIEKETAVDATPVNAALVENYYHQLKDIAVKVGIPEPEDWIYTLTRMPDVLTKTDVEVLDDEEWVIRTDNGSLVITGGRPRGTLYGVYEFLEGQGIVWADETTEFVPSLAEIRFDKPVAIKDKPALRGRNVYTQLRMPSKASTMYYIRNKLNHYHTITEEYGGGFSMGRPGNCHTFHYYSKPEWPDEWFALSANGKRIRSTSSSGPGQFCLTNPDLRKAMVERLKQAYGIEIPYWEESLAECIEKLK